MWEDILLSIGEAVITATGSKLIEQNKRNKFAEKIQKIIHDELAKYADSSLDCDGFYSLAKSTRFSEMLWLFFCSTKDEMGSIEYVNVVEKYLVEQCPSVNHIDVRHFLSELKAIYVENLHTIIAESPEMSALFRLLNLSNRDILSKLSESEENIMNYLKSLSNAAISIDNDEILSYHNVCEKQFGTISFTGIVGAESKKAQNIDKFYVRNTFSLYPIRDVDRGFRQSIDEIEPIQLVDFFDYGSKVVLIGAAGHGKSTTLNYIFCKYEDLFHTFALKIKIDLKEYARNIDEENQDILWCITTEFGKRIRRAGKTFSEIEKLLTDYLKQGKCLVIFDALDEVPTQSIRNKVRDEIGSFCEIYYLNRFIISTREAGYLRNQFDDSFLHIRINEFNPSQIKEYSKNWYCSYYDENGFVDFWDNFEKEVKHARCESLISNPIILILALVIFDIEKSLPNKRVEFYKKCIDTFLTVREDRKAAYKLSDKAKSILAMDSVVPRIAHYKYSKFKENVGYQFKETELHNAIFSAIESDDKLNWGAAVKEYSNYLIERTELIREFDEEVFDFSHKTFYEYFLAVYFSKEIENKELINILNSGIGDANNDELVKLIIEVIIQNGDQKQINSVMDYIFSQLPDYRAKRVTRKQAYTFLILADLYAHNMLQPKYHSKYHCIILYNPELFMQIGFSPLRDYSFNYDVNMLANIYCDEVLNHDKFADTIDSLYYLDQAYRDQISEIIKEEYILHIISLFSYKGFYETIYRLEFNYFTNDGLAYFLSFPQVFLLLMTVMVEYQDYSKIDIIFDYSFGENSMVLRYSNPYVVCKLFEKAIKNKKIFLLFLIVAIECAKDITSLIFAYLFRDAKSKKNSSHSDKLQNYVVWLWKLFNHSTDYTVFREELKKAGLFIVEYDNIYQKIYQHYQEYDQKISMSIVEDSLQEIKKRADQLLMDS